MNEPVKERRADDAPMHSNTRWAHRRRMAYAGLVFSAVSWATGIIIGLKVTTAQAESVIIPLSTMGFWGGLGLASLYYGNSAVENFAALRSAGK